MVLSAWSNAHKGYGVQSEMWSSMASLWLIDVSYRFGPPMWSLAGPSDFFGNDQSFELGLGFLWVDLCSLTPNIGLDKSQLTFYGSRWRQLTLRFLGLCLGS